MAPNKQSKITSSKFYEKWQDVSKGRNYPKKKAHIGPQTQPILKCIW